MARLSTLAGPAILTACGPIYLHDPASFTAASGTQEDVRAVFEEDRSGRLVAGQRQFRLVQDEIDRTLDAASRDVQVAALSSGSWSALTAAIAAEMEATREEIGPPSPLPLAECQRPGAEALAPGSRRQQRDAVTEELQAALVANTAAATRADSLLTAMNQAAAMEARYAATQKLLSTGLSALVQPTADAEQRRLALEALAKETVPMRSFEEGELGPVETLGRVSVGEALGLDLTALAQAERPTSLADLVGLAGAAQALSGFKGLVPTTPGIEVTIVGLGYDVARAEELRMAALVDGARRRLALHDRHLAFLERHESTAVQASCALAAVLDIGGVNGDQEIRTTLEILSSRGRGRRADLAAAYSAVGQYAQVVLKGRPIRESFDNQVDAILVDQELAQADVALREREAVILRGLEGLVAFHEGGIDADDVRNVIGVAQAIGIFAIAAK